MLSYRRLAFPACATAALLSAAACAPAPAETTPTTSSSSGGDTNSACPAPPTVAEASSPSGFTHSSGPGGPKRVFEKGELQKTCAYLTNPVDKDKHNTVTMLDGYLVMPWCPDSGGGGVSVYEFDDPCNPMLVGNGTDSFMRETHAAGF